MLLPAFGNAAVKDKNTGLVWEQSPNEDGVLRTGTEAIDYCYNKSVGGSFGWWLPTVVELSSLRDPTTPAPFVPAIFSGVHPYYYWSSSYIEQYVKTNGFRGMLGVSFYVTWSSAWYPLGRIDYHDIGNPFYVWCVRGEE